MSGLKLLTLNIECDKHLDRVLPFLEEEAYDVICLQEIFKEHVSLFESRLEMKAIYTMSAFLRRNNTLKELGVCILSRLPVKHSHVYTYFEADDKTPISSDFDPLRMLRKVMIAEIEKNSQLFRIAATHFTWSENGQATDLQRDHVTKMLDYLGQYNELILCGDFNAPRGREIFTKIANVYRDNVPSFVTTSIDASLHAAGDLQLMVDGILTTPGYQAENVTMHGGLSDHLGVSALLQLVSKVS